MAPKRAHQEYDGDLLHFFGEFCLRPLGTTRGGGSIVSRNPTDMPEMAIWRFFHLLVIQSPYLPNLGANWHRFAHKISLLGLSMVMERELGIFCGFLHTLTFGDYFFAIFDHSDHCGSRIWQVWVPFGAFWPTRTPPPPLGWRFCHFTKPILVDTLHVW